MIDFIIKSSLSLLTLLVFYHLILEREKMHRFNRFYLLFSLVISLVLPFVTFEMGESVPVQSVKPIVLPEISSVFILPEKKTSYLPMIFWGLYSLITLVLLVRFVKNVRTMLVKAKANKSLVYKNARLVLLKEKTLPHTFLNVIFINENDYADKKIEEELFAHELIHVTQKHTLDILWIEFLKVVFWFNPLFSFYKKAIQLNHEFLADQGVVSTYKNVPFYQTLLLQKGSETQTIYLASNLNYLVTKKRLIMMTKETSGALLFAKKIAVVPVFAGLIFFLCSETVAKETKAASVFQQMNKEVTPGADKTITAAASEENGKGFTPVSQESSEKKYSEDKTETVQESKTENEPDEVIVQEAKNPDFPGGMREFMKYFATNFKYPENLKITEPLRLVASFNVTKEGIVTGIKVLKGYSKEVDEEIIRVLKASPKWIPGEKDGKKIDSEMTLPIQVQVR